MTTASLPPALQRRREYAGPALFSYGFRPFFLGGAVWAALGMLLWLPQYLGELTLPSAMGPLEWHIHEMLFGYLAAVIAGFLLTAIPNWTGRLPVNGLPLAALATLWLAGRLMVLFSAKTGVVAAAIVDIAFLAALAAVAAREIIAGHNWRNLRVLGLVVVLIAGNTVFHFEAAQFGAASVGVRLGLAGAVGLVMLIGGRIVPSFTHNWLARRQPGRMPVSFSKFDAVSLIVSGIALLGWIMAPARPEIAILLIAGGIMQTIRFARWAGERTWADRLVLVLHAAYVFVPAGFFLIGAAVLWPDQVPASAGLHAWTAGALSLMPLAVMTRATLGHTGRALVALAATQTIYALALAAATGRIAASFVPDPLLLNLAGLAWIAAFAGYVMVYGPMLIKARVSQ